jgi:hypothetical protein
MSGPAPGAQALGAPQQTTVTQEMITFAKEINKILPNLFEINGNSIDNLDSVNYTTIMEKLTNPQGKTFDDIFEEFKAIPDFKDFAINNGFKELVEDNTASAVVPGATTLASNPVSNPVSNPASNPASSSVLAPVGGPGGLPLPPPPGGLPLPPPPGGLPLPPPPAIKASTKQVILETLDKILTENSTKNITYDILKDKISGTLNGIISDNSILTNILVTLFDKIVLNDTYQDKQVFNKKLKSINDTILTDDTKTYGGAHRSRKLRRSRKH